MKCFNELLLSEFKLEVRKIDPSFNFHFFILVNNFHFNSTTRNLHPTNLFIITCPPNIRKSRLLSAFPKDSVTAPPISMALLYSLHSLAFLCSFWPTVIPLSLNYPVVFNFGDSNSDTGGLVAGKAFPMTQFNGETYFHEPSGRFCDGRLIIDFLSTCYSSIPLHCIHMIHI